jgi:diaminohydroxyphosphoribosylaminopyrimidine deaminase / 5-amino-6-(5-phosphoribosylamino)uracil reductase
MCDRYDRRPRVTVHYAQTLDGRIATLTGNSQWISCEESLRLAHEIRASHQAVMVGIGTILADDPRLTVRLAPGASPLRVVVDSSLRISPRANVFGDNPGQTIIITTPAAPVHRMEAIADCGARILCVASEQDGRVSLVQALRQLFEVGIDSIMIEGGRALITSVLRQRLVDRLIVCVAPKLVGTGIDAVGDLEIRRLSEALILTDVRITQVGKDVVFDGQMGGVPVGQR